MIESVLESGDVTKKDGDDYAAHVYITFDYPVFNLGFGDKIKYRFYQTFTSFDVPTRALNYIWVNKAEVGSIHPNPYTDWVQVLAVQSGNNKAETWQSEKRNIPEDYKAAFGEEPPAITGSQIMTDSDNTGESARSAFGKLILRKVSDSDNLNDKCKYRKFWQYISSKKLKMPNLEYSYSVPFKVRSYEVDHNKEASVSAICNYFQEAAGLHARKLDFDISDLQKQGLTWILYKLQVKVHVYPERWESVQVKTWPSTGDGLRAYRDYELYNENDELLAVGLSQWMVVDVRKKRPVKMPDELMSSRYKTDRHVLDLHKSNLKKLDSDKANFITTAGLNDLDMNKHVNNVRYIDWMTGYNLLEKDQKKCNEIIIQFSAETKAGDKIYLSNQTNPNLNSEINCTLFKNNDKQIIAIARTSWS